MGEDELFEYDSHERLGHMLWDVSNRSAALTEAALSATPLNPSTSGVLDVIAAAPGTSIADMARRLPTSAQGISQSVARLERLGFLERRLGARGHGVALFITETGERARAEAAERKVALEAELSEALGERDYEALIRLLKRARPVIAELEASRRRER